MSFWINFLYLLSLTVWVGSMIFFSFATTPMIFKVLPRDMASQLISAIFPLYYKIGYFCSGPLLATTLFDSFLARNREMPWIRILLIVLMLGCNAYAGAIIRPETHQLKIQMKSVEADSEIGTQLQTRFSSLHRLSVILNLIVMAAGIFLIAIVAWRLRL